MCNSSVTSAWSSVRWASGEILGKSKRRKWEFIFTSLLYYAANSNPLEPLPCISQDPGNAFSEFSWGKLNAGTLKGCGQWMVSPLRTISNRKRLPPSSIWRGREKKCYAAGNRNPDGSWSHHSTEAVVTERHGYWMNCNKDGGQILQVPLLSQGNIVFRLPSSLPQSPTGASP